MERRDALKSFMLTAAASPYIGAYDAAGKASVLHERVERLRMCADFVNAAWPPCWEIQGWKHIYSRQWRGWDEALQFATLVPKHIAVPPGL